jgi:uncharacterized protein YcbX
MPPLRIAALTVYPVKSAAGVSCKSWDVDDFGLRYDRRWVVTDPEGVFQTQRTVPRLALLEATVSGGALRLQAPGRRPIELALAPEGGRLVRVRVWNDETRGIPVAPEADAWLTSFLGTASQLVYMPHAVVRAVNPAYGAPGDRVSFADAFPFLMISEASLADLNRRLAVPLPMNRFRPNVVVSGCEPYAEDGWRRFRACGIEFQVAKPCARCVVTTTDQRTLERGPEPLRTLATYRRRGNDVLFGQNAIHRGTGRLTVGGSVELAE